MAVSFKNEINRSLSLGVEVGFDCLLSDLDDLALGIAESLQPGDWLLLNGDLGAGKTTFTQKLATSLGFLQTVTSPTYSIVNVVDLQRPVSQIQRICHLDLYRLKRSDELLHLGLEMEFSSNSICLIEWAENVEGSGWLNFFTTTGCRKPKRILNISIFQNDKKECREYRIHWESPEKLIQED
jgi:tRNA threonylcarbamoyl adenosine modification protein YjeE